MWTSNPPAPQWKHDPVWMISELISAILSEVWLKLVMLPLEIFDSAPWLAVVRRISRFGVSPSKASRIKACRRQQSIWLSQKQTGPEGDQAACVFSLSRCRECLAFNVPKWDTQPVSYFYTHTNTTLPPLYQYTHTST